MDRLKFLEEAAWKAWNESKRDATINRVVLEGVSENQKQRVEQTTRSQRGNVQILDLILKVLMRRCHMLGFAKAADTHEEIHPSELNQARQETIANPKAIDMRRQIDGLEDVFAGFIREDSQPRTLEIGATFGGAGSSIDGSGVGTPSEIDRADAAPSWEI